ncbi:hypothetical protein E3_0300 [Rhodococcus phage E3]|uniref:hypothetical protein n=1 Tax=Rhodococcus phage E3 TaxID=1007869 RepID=UPI0002C6D855|nr:hypothetical protein M176_gp031 [Rhodococcus phage E3]AEQ20941.1 hypothetical protein E3_0300 [Rhodococcus phage E3]
MADIEQTINEKKPKTPTPEAMREMAGWLESMGKPVLGSELRVMATDLEIRQSNAMRELLREAHRMANHHAANYCGIEGIGRDFAAITRLIRNGSAEIGLELR